MEEEPLFKTKTGKEGMDENLSGCRLNELTNQRVRKVAIGVAASANFCFSKSSTFAARSGVLESPRDSEKRPRSSVAAAP
jgi:hypothetical protein